MHEKPSYVEKLEIESKEIPNGQESPNIVQLVTGEDQNQS